MTRALIASVLALAALPAGAGAHARPDLTVTALSSAQASAAAGGSLSLVERTANRGRSAARRSVTAVYLSRDNRRSRGDIQLGARRVAALKRRKTSRATLTLRLPMLVPGNTYRLLACADDTRHVAESNERNNCRAAARRIVVTGAIGPVQPVRIAVTLAGSGSGSVTSAPAGIDCGNACTGVFPPGTAVVLTAVAAQGSRFAGWNGACSGTAATCDATGDVTALFVMRVTGTGAAMSGGIVQVSSTDPAAACSGGTCEVDAGSDVTYTASPDAGYRFASWIGDCAGQPNRVVTVTGAMRNTSCIASFTRSFRVSWSASPAAGGVIVGGISSGSGTCDSAGCDVDPGASVQITRTTAAGYRFLGWNQACAPDNPLNGQITLANIRASYSCVASFVRQHTISWAVKSGGAVKPAAGTVTKGTTTGFVVCQTSSCVGDATGATAGHISLTASANQGYRFAGWSCTGTAVNPLQLDFSVDRVCDANFVAQYTVTFATDPVESGSVTGQVILAPSGLGSCGATSCTVDAGSSVLLTAGDNLAWIFDHWSGDCSGATNPYTLAAISANKTCTADFVPR